MIHFARKRPFPQALPQYLRIHQNQTFSDHRSCKNIPTVKRPGTACVPHHNCVCTKNHPRHVLTLGKTDRWVVSFIPTGCICPVAGGRLPPTGPEGRNRGTFVSASTNGASPWRGWMVVLRAANQNQMIAGGNHTLISSLGQRRYIVPCIGWYHSTLQVVIATWRAADLYRVVT